MDVLAQLDELSTLLGDVVGGIRADQLDRPTPCAQFDVAGVLAHMIGGATLFAAAFRGGDPTPAETSNVLAGFGPALGELGAAIRAPGALERPIASPFGELSGETFARFVVLDGLVHGWDLAMATGQGYHPSAPLVAEVHGFAEGALEGLRDGDTFAAATEPPRSATAIERLAACTGRTVSAELR